MATITEDYVSFETAKLLKEKGFDEELDMVYSQYGDLHKIFDLEYYNATYEFSTISNSHYNDITSNKYNFFATAPTLQMAMKWLRKSHNIHIEIARGPKGYHINIVIIPLGVVKYITRDIVKTTYVDSYEEACEVAIKYCLKNLI